VPNGATSRGSILIVDDEPAVAEMLRDIFIAQGYAVDGASNGGDAVMLASLSRPDAVILDIKLPDTTGAEVLARIHELDDSIPVVMLSGSDDEDMARALLKAGAMDYIRKPFQFDQLLQAVSLAVEVGKGRPRRGVSAKPTRCRVRAARSRRTYSTSTVTARICLTSSSRSTGFLRNALNFRCAPGK
jgi:DNA-binding response OmpR family regulator